MTKGDLCIEIIGRANYAMDAILSVTHRMTEQLKKNRKITSKTLEPDLKRAAAILSAMSKLSDRAGLDLASQRLLSMESYLLELLPLSKMTPSQGADFAESLTLVTKDIESIVERDVVPLC